MAPARLLLLAAALVLAALPAAAQGDTCAMTAAVNPPRLQHQPSQGLRYNFTVAVDQASQGGDVAIVVESVTEGWDATVAPGAFPGLAPGQQATAEVLVVAPPATGARQAQVTITATLTCAMALPLPLPLPPQTATQSQVLSPAMVVPAPAGPGDGGAPGADSTALLVVGGLGVIAIAGAATVLLRPRGLVVRVPEPRRDLPPGGGASFPIAVENRGKDAVEVVVRVLGVPPTWKLLAPPAHLALKPGAATTLQVLVRSPADARPGDAADIHVQFLERRSGRLRQVDVTARVAGGAAERPDVVVRDERALDPR